jgi:hypothetical protein
MITSILRLVPHLVLCVAIGLVPSVTFAVSPEGRLLFERNWATGNPTFGSDGLGPLFNGQSCVACHNQGGVGGSGDARFNAVSLAIESLEFASVGSTETLSETLSRDQVALFIREFYAGFIRPDGSIMNTAAIPHHGGSETFRQLRDRMYSMVSAERSKEGGAVNAAEVRQANTQLILFSNRISGVTSMIRARLFHRNTSPCLVPD